MAITTLGRQPSISELLGTGLGSGLSQGIQGLLQSKLQELGQRQQAQTYQRIGLPGYLSSLDPSIQKEIVKYHLAVPSQETFAQTLSSLMGGQQEKPSTTIQPELPIMSQEASIPDVGVEPHQAFPRPLTPKLTQDQAFKLAQLQLQKEKMSAKEKADAFKLTKDERKEIASKARAARTNLQDLERLEELEREGKLDTPGYVEFLQRVGLDIPALMSPGSEEFQKIAQTFMRDAKTYLGARISNFELEQFLKTIPSLSQSPEGRKRVISNLKKLNRVALEYNKALHDVIKENKGVPPLDLSEKIDEKIDKRLDAITKKFKEDIAKEVPPGQNKLITALQSILGSALGAPSALLKGVGGKVLGSGLELI